MDDRQDPATRGMSLYLGFIDFTPVFVDNIVAKRPCVVMGFLFTGSGDHSVVRCGINLLLGRKRIDGAADTSLAASAEPILLLERVRCSRLSWRGVRPCGAVYESVVTS